MDIDILKVDQTQNKILILNKYLNNRIIKISLKIKYIKMIELNKVK